MVAKIWRMNNTLIKIVAELLPRDMWHTLNSTANECCSDFSIEYYSGMIGSVSSVSRISQVGRKYPTRTPFQLRTVI